MCEDVSGRAQTYFSSLNSMARRIMVDATSVRELKAVDEYFAPQKVREKYAFYPQSEPDVECFPKLCVRSGGKYVVDEDNHGKGSGCTWRDEHSSPFVWETQSQLDLSYVGTDNVLPQSKHSKTDSAAVVFVAERDSSSDFRKVENVDDGSPVNKPPPARMFLTKKMEKQLSGKCFEKASLSALLPPLPDRPPPQPSAATNKSTNGSTGVSSMKCPPPKPPSKKMSCYEPPVSERKKAEFKLKPVISCGDVSSVAASVEVAPTLPSADARKTVTIKEPAKAVETAEIQLTSKFASVEIDSSPSDDIPKTGFDFLDNW